MASSADPDQLASESGSTLFTKTGYIRVQQDKGYKPAPVSWSLVGCSRPQRISYTMNCPHKISLGRLIYFSNNCYINYKWIKQMEVFKETVFFFLLLFFFFFCFVFFFFCFFFSWLSLPRKSAVTLRKHAYSNILKILYQKLKIFR